MKISIIGCGKVGSATAFALLSLSPDEILLIDIVKDLIRAEELDLSHAAVAVSPKTLIKSSTEIKEAKDSDFIVITAGKPRTSDSNETRADLAKINEPIIRGFMEQITKIAPEAHIIIVTNPSTQMAEIAKKYCPKVIAMDNQPDTARLKYFISKELGKPVDEVESCVTGEHGENMQLNIKDNLNAEQLEKVRKGTLNAGSNIIKGKGYTNWGIAAQICETIKRLKI